MLGSMMRHDIGRRQRGMGLLALIFWALISVLVFIVVELGTPSTNYFNTTTLTQPTQSLDREQTLETIYS